VLVQKMVLVAFDKKVPDHLLVAQLVSSLVVRDVIAPSHVEAAMELLLKQVGDLLMDMPKVLEYLVALLAHFIQDGLVQLCILDLAESLAGVQEGAEIKSKVLAVMKVPLAATSTKVLVRTILDDYFASGDLHSAVAALAELEGKRPGQEAVKRCLVLALEMKDSGKERGSVLLSAMTRVYGTEQFFEGFIATLRNMDDLALDTPRAVEILALFIARAMVDDVLPPAFISLVPPRVAAASERVRQVLAQVEVLMASRGTMRVVNAWGGGASWDVDLLKHSVKTLVAEYYVANDLEEAVRCVVALDAAHFGHEIVKRTVYEALERGGAGTSAYGVLLLKTLLSRHALDAAQISKGMVRVVVGMDDLTLDVPSAHAELVALLHLMQQDALITGEFKDKVMHMTITAAAA